MNVRHLREGFAFFVSENGTARHHLVGTAGEKPQHFDCLGFIFGFSQNDAAADHDGVGGNHHVFGVPGNGKGLFPAQPGNLVKGRLARVHGFVNVRGPYGKGNAVKTQQFLSPRGSGRENELHSVSFLIDN